jgi:hypothetical protein
MWGPMVIAIIFGLVFATLLMLGVVFTGLILGPRDRVLLFSD